jgi:ribose 5-phosphate isomerase B
MKIVLASDHGAIELRNALRDFILSTTDLTVSDLGTCSEDSVDYPDIADLVAKEILSGKAALGILCCGTGIGISIRANRYKGVRAALVYSEETAAMAKAHNNANVLCLGGRTTSIEEAQAFVKLWLDTEFEGGRHQRRVQKLDSDCLC